MALLEAVGVPVRLQFTFMTYVTCGLLECDYSLSFLPNSNTDSDTRTRSDYGLFEVFLPHLGSNNRLLEGTWQGFLDT